MRYRMVKKIDFMLSRFHLIPEHDGWTNRQTDRFAISISCISVLTRDKNEKICSVKHSKHTQPQVATSWFVLEVNQTICCRVTAKKTI